MDIKIIVYGLSLPVAILAIFASASGLFWKGLYGNDTVSYSTMAAGQDLVTLVVAVPLLLISLYFAVRGSMKWHLVWMGAVFYFLYTYASAVFSVSYNPLFLVYVACFSLSLFTFAVSLLSIDVETIKGNFSIKTPRKLVAGFYFIIGAGLALMWLSSILGSMLAGRPPAQLETYTTLVIQGMDLGIVVPIAILTGVLLLMDNAWGYALASIYLIKGTTLGIALMSMILFMIMNGLPVSIIEIAFFSTMTAGCAILTAAFYASMSGQASTIIQKRQLGQAKS